MEVVPALFSDLRPQGNYETSLELLRRIQRYNEHPPMPSSHIKIITKSGFMVGLGESWEDIVMLLHDLASVGCERVTIGQYQQPTRNHSPVVKYYHPDEFAFLRGMAYKMGLKHVEAGPLVRSSYRAAETM
jgi:lipoic acid synthetase